MSVPLQNYLIPCIPVLLLIVILSESRFCAAQYTPYVNPQYSMSYPSALYTANSEVLPRETAGGAAQPIPAGTARDAEINENKPEEEKPSNPFTKIYRYWFKSNSKNSAGTGNAVVKPAQSSLPAPDVPVSARNNDGIKTTAAVKNPWYMFWKKDEENTESKTEKLPDISVDKGQEEVALLEQERSFSERDYVDSAVKSSKTAAKNDYAQGLQLEGLGDYDGAAHCYNKFIKANKKQTANGTLAAPYHRLALLAWKQKEWDKADVYFRHGQQYAQGGNIAIISGDYSLFLVEQGRPEQAEIILRNTLLYFPKDQRLLICLGRCCARRDKPVEALRYLTSVMSEDQAYHELAGLYHQIGDYKSARIMNEKRDELFAMKSVNSIYGSAQPANTPYINNQSAVLPVNKPPVMDSLVNPAGNSTALIPYPLINPLLPSRSPASYQTNMQANPQTAASPYYLPQDLNPEPASQIPASAMPVIPFVPDRIQDENPAQKEQTLTKVYHYPANGHSPVYHQYAGNSYPQTVPVQIQSANNPSDTKNYWASAVPASGNSAAVNSTETIPADPFALQPALRYSAGQQPMPMVAEQRGGYPLVPSYPQNNIQ